MFLCVLTYLLHGADCFLKLRDTPSGNTPPPRRTEWGSSSPPDFFVSRGSISCCEYFLTGVFSRGGVVSTSPNPQAGGPPLVGCPRLLIRFIHSYPPYWRPFLHPQPEDAPCRGDRDPHSWVSDLHTIYNIGTKVTSGGLHEKHVVTTWNLGNHLSICF